MGRAYLPLGRAWAGRRGTWAGGKGTNRTFGQGVGKQFVPFVQYFLSLLKLKNMPKVGCRAHVDTMRSRPTKNPSTGHWKGLGVDIGAKEKKIYAGWAGCNAV